MYLTLLLCSFSLTVASSIDLHEKMLVEMELTDFDLQDLNDEISKSTEDALLQNDFKAKVIAEGDMAEFLLKQREFLKDLTESPDDLQRKIYLLLKPGDFLLPSEDFNHLSSFSNVNVELLRTGKIKCFNSTLGCTMDKQDIYNTLATAKNLEQLKNTWSEWQEVVLRNKKEFSSVLELISKSANLNEQEGAVDYWEMLTEINEGYSLANLLWEEVKPLYDKLQNFVFARFNNYYNNSLENSTEIPIYILGSSAHFDWTDKADIILPNSLLFFQGSEKFKSIDSKKTFEIAEKMVIKMRFKKFGEKFWKYSYFNQTICDIYSLNYCNEKYSKVFTCDKVSWQRYFEIHETALKIALLNQDYSFCVYETLRYSVLDDAITGLGTIFAMDSLYTEGTLENKDDQKVMKMMMVALRIFPKLAYYLTADTWRIQELQNRTKHFGESWENIRRDFTGLKGLTDEEYDVLEDPYVTSNKPYLSKFLGIFLQFQIMDFYNMYMNSESNSTLLDTIGEDDTLTNILSERKKNDWLNSINFITGIDAISASSLINYFQPLMDYLENAPIEVKIQEFTTISAKTTQTTSKSLLKSVFQVNETETNSTEATYVYEKKPETPSNVLYIGVAILMGLMVVVAGYVAVKRLRKRRPKTNNRRFET